MSDPGWTGITTTSGMADIVLTALGYQPDIKALSGPIAHAAMKSGGAEVHIITRVGWPDACPNAARLFRNMTFGICMENQLTGRILAGTAAADAGTEWLKGNHGTLTFWLDGVTTLDGHPGEAAANAALGL